MLRAAAVLALWLSVAAAQSRERGTDARPPAKPFEEARSDYEAAARGEDGSALARALVVLARSGFLSEDKRDGAFARGVLRRCLKHKSVEVRAAAATGYGHLRLAGSSRDLRGILRAAPRGRQPDAVVLAAIESWGILRDPGTHGELLALIEKPSDEEQRRTQALAAARAIGGYRTLPRDRRAEVVSDLLRVFEALFAASHRRTDEDCVEVRWWRAVAPSLVGAFNALTNQRCEDYYECRDWWQENRRAFADPRSAPR